jgi:hypothetical protein
MLVHQLVRVVIKTPDLEARCHFSPDALGVTLAARAAHFGGHAHRQFHG